MSVYEWTAVRVAENARDQLLAFLQTVNTSDMLICVMEDGSITIDMETFRGGPHAELENFVAGLSVPYLYATGPDDYFIDYSHADPAWEGCLMPDEDDKTAHYYPDQKVWTMTEIPSWIEFGKQHILKQGQLVSELEF